MLYWFILGSRILYITRYGIGRIAIERVGVQHQPFATSQIQQYRVSICLQASNNSIYAEECRANKSDLYRWRVLVYYSSTYWEDINEESGD